MTPSYFEKSPIPPPYYPLSGGQSRGEGRAPEQEEQSEGYFFTTSTHLLGSAPAFIMDELAHYCLSASPFVH